MKNLRLNTVVTTIFIASLFVIVSCSNKDEKTAIIETQNEFFLQMQERFNEVGVINILDDYVLTEEESNVLSSVVGNTKAAFRTEYIDGSLVYGFKLHDYEQYLTVKVYNGEILKSFEAEMFGVDNDTEFVIAENKQIVKTYTFANNAHKDIIAINGEPVVSLKSANCDDLGPRRDDESFGDCFSRNWSNFCCDFIGCMSQVASPYLIAGAISLVCVC